MPVLIVTFLEGPFNNRLSQHIAYHTFIFNECFCMRKQKWENLTVLETEKPDLGAGLEGGRGESFGTGAEV